MWCRQSFTWHSDPWTMSRSCATIFLAFVALVLPFDSFEGLQGQTCGLLYGLEGVTALGRLQAAIAPRLRGRRLFRDPQETDQERQCNSNIVGPDPIGVVHVRLGSEGTRNSEVVQRFERLRVHPAPDGRRCFRALLRHRYGRLQVPQRRSSGGVRSEEGPEGPSGRERYKPLSL